MSRSDDELLTPPELNERAQAVVFKDILFVLSLVTFYGVAFLSYAAVGNLIAGQKIRTVDDFLHPFSKSNQLQFGTKKQPNFFFAIYYLASVVFLIISLSQIMFLRSSFRAWIDRLMGIEEEEEQATAAPTAGSSTSLNTKYIA